MGVVVLVLSLICQRKMVVVNWDHIKNVAMD